MFGQARLRVFLMPIIMLTVAACATMKTVRDAPVDAGDAQSFDAPFETVKTATLDAVHDLKLEPSSVSETSDGFTILISRAPHGFSDGEVGRIVVEHNSAPPTTVHVRYQRRSGVQFFIGSEDHFARGLFSRITAALAISVAH